jgi:hypothetical protein
MEGEEGEEGGFDAGEWAQEWALEQAAEWLCSCGSARTRKPRRDMEDVKTGDKKDAKKNGGKKSARHKTGHK